ncbi:MAG: cytochrome c biogenesis protein ResB [Salinibacterium sp.]|nr:cytochrome c biogenesis protein ResB [Salinibacterium sp.]
MRTATHTPDVRPDDHFDQDPTSEVRSPRLGLVGWLRWGWRLLTSMRTALLLLLLLAIAAIPGSLVPQRTADPNGVALIYREDPARAQVLESLQLFTVYTSVWFSAVYLLLFVSLIGCVIPRTRHHWAALRQAPPRTPARFSRLPASEIASLPKRDRNVRELAEDAALVLRAARYRIAFYDTPGGASSVAGERGYLRETGNLLFHVSLIGVLVSIAVGGGYRYAGQRVIVEGETFVNARGAYDTFTAGQLFSESALPAFSLSLENFAVSYLEGDPSNLGFITDYTATVQTRTAGSSDPASSTIRVNEPLAMAGTEIYLLGNGYAPTIVFRDPDGQVVLREEIPFLPQDSNLTSLGVVKVPDGLRTQVGAIGFFYPTQSNLESGAYTSVYPDLLNPVLTLNIFTGDLGIDDGTPRSVYSLDTSEMTQLTGGDTGTDSVELRPGERADLPDGLGSVELVDVKRFASFDIAYDPTKLPVLVFTLLAVLGLGLGLFVPRRRVWFRFSSSSETQVTLEAGALSRGDDPQLEDSLRKLTQLIADPQTTTREKK